MRIARILGTVTLSQMHPSLEKGAFKLVAPYTREELEQGAEPGGEELVAFDHLAAGTGQNILLSEGPEAAQPFYPQLVPIDAYNTGLIDSIHFPPRSSDGS